MATRRPKRHEWRRTKQGLWTCSLGTRGLRVRLFEKRKGGMFYRATWSPGTGRSIAALHTSDRTEAERLGNKLLGAMLSGVSPEQGPVRLGELWSRFERENGEYLNNKPRSRADAAMRAKVLIAYFGENFDVRHLTSRHQHEYTQARQRGGINVSEQFVTKPVRKRSVEADLVLLHQMLSWASRVPIGNGGRWLERNPLAGVRREREKNPRRAVATWERFVATRTAMQKLADEARAEADRAKRDAEATENADERATLEKKSARFEAAQARWIKMELALVLAEATGRRLGSIRALLWEDIDFARQRITWRAEADKKGVEWVVPLTPALAEELRQFQRKLGAIGGSLFPAEQDSSKVMDRYLFNKWLAVAEAEAKLEKLPGSLWHAYRRKWASERMHLPLKAVAEGGGWKDTTTLLTSYQHADEATLFAVMAEPRKRHEVAAPA
jgi:integrase